MANPDPDSQPSILVVDDEAVVFLRTLLIILRQAGYNVAGVSTGSAALQFIDEHSPQVVLVDLHLPDLDGAQSRRVFGGKTALAKTFVMTGDPYAWEGSAASTKLAAVQVLEKPLRPDSLLACIQPALANSHNGH